jgi:hypothetical protein
MKTDKKNTVRNWIFRLMILAVIIALFCTNIFGNICMLIIEKEYFIPTQSSIFTFNETVHNDGSSDVWRYGQDGNNYYYNLSTFDNDVLFFSKKNIDNCPGFNPENISTWCNVKIPEKDSK